jgi:hypothetical protein
MRQCQHKEIAMKVYVSKYALNGGIREVATNYFPTEKGTLIVIEPYLHARWGQWHTDRASAVAEAERMRVKKIASLKKSIAKLENMKFD